MSRVTNALLSFDILEDVTARTWDLLRVTEAFFEGRQNWRSIDLNDESYGGSKFMETPLFAAAFNHFNRPAYLELLTSITWAEPHNVQLICKEQEQDRFHIWHLPRVKVPPKDWDDFTRSFIPNYCCEDDS